MKNKLLAVYLLVASLIMLIWIYLSIYFFMDGRSDAFQRMGSLGVFAFLMMLPIHRLVTEEMEADRIKTLKRKIQKAKKEELMRGEVSDFLAAEIDWYRDGEKYAWKQRYIVAASEIVLIGISTLQWGFGDLLVIATHGSMGICM